MAFVLFASGLIVASLANAADETRTAVNAGGPALDGGWKADAKADPVAALKTAGGTRVNTTSKTIDLSHPSVPNSAPMKVFQSFRADLREAPEMRWEFPVEPGAWEVRLYFSENADRRQGVGLRMFDVSIEDAKVLTNFDVFREAGGGYRGIMAAFFVQADDVLDVRFEWVKARPIVSGIELISLEGERDPDTSQPPPSPSPTPTPAPEPTGTPAPAPTTPPSGCNGVKVASGGDLRAAVNGAPQGAAICLTGKYVLNAPVAPKQGQSFIGPAVLVAGGGNHTGFQVRTRDVSFVNLEMSGFTVRGIECWAGTRVIGGRYHHNGRNGIGCGLDGEGGVLVDGVEVDHNGSDAVLGQGSSGMKFARAHGVVVRNSFIHDNVGSGVWCDVQCGDYTVVDSTIVRNSRKGVHYEKSGAADEEGTYEGFAYIARNVIQDNGWEGREYAADGGVALVSSKNALIEQNVFGRNPRGGVFIRQDDRLSGEKHGWVISNVVVRNNTMNGDRIVGCDISGVKCA